MVLLGVDLGVEGAVGEVVDAYSVDGTAELGDHLDEQVVCQRAVERFALDGQLHRLGLIATDENREEFVPRTEDDDGRARAFVADADTDALDGGLVHTHSTTGGYEKISRPVGLTLPAGPVDVTDRERRSEFKCVRDVPFHMPTGDPYSPVRPFVYECVGCQLRVQADSQPETCPECGCVMCDLSVPRE